MSAKRQPTTHADAAEHPDDGGELIMFLEPDQLVVDRSRPIPRAQLSRKAKAALWALRVFMLVMTAMVIYTFFSQLTR